MFNLSGKIAVVTGASQGIGRDTALALAETGAKVAVAARNEEKLAELVQEISTKGGEAFAVKMDVADGDQIKSGFKAILEKFGKIDILVNNAAITRDGLAVRMKPDDWDAVIRTNLTGAHLCIQQVLMPMMKAKGGRIINISSVVAESGNAGQANYVAAKAGIIGLTKAIAADFAGRGIRCNVICPGTIQTPSLDERIAGLGHIEEARAAFIARQPMARLGRPEEIAALAVHLASDESAFTTGQIHVIDGGWTG